MLEGGQPDKPVITVLSSSTERLEHEVLAGIEEEGVPFVLERPGRAGGDAETLAAEAAQRSPLGVGVGIDVNGRICIQHEKLSEPLDGLLSAGSADAVYARIAGHNAARIVMGIPLRLGAT